MLEVCLMMWGTLIDVGGTAHRCGGTLIDVGDCQLMWGLPVDVEDFPLMWGEPSVDVG